MKNYFLLLLLSITTAAYSQPGTLDSTFGINGQVYNDFGDDIGRCNGSALQKDGRIVCVGDGNMKLADTILSGFLLVRYLNDGMPDESFGASGRIITSFPNGGGYANAVAIQPDGKIVAVGYGGFFNSNTGTDFFVVRYNPDGSLDKSFGDSGLVTTDYGLAQSEYANAVAIQPDGKLVVTGDYAGQYFFTVRYNTDGSLDESFGNRGKVLAPWGGLSMAWAIAVQPDGKILTAGMYSSHYAVVARYLPDGKPDSSFGKNGVVYNYKGSIYNTICLQPDGKILAGGQTGEGLSGDMLVVRYSNNGTPDSTFGINSSAVFKFPQPGSKAVSLDLYGNDKIMVAGTAFNAFDPKVSQVVALFLSLSNGILDSTYGENGYATVSIEGINTAAGLLAKDGDVIIQGINGEYDGVYLFRFKGFSQQQTPIARIKRWLHKHGITWDDCPPSICNNVTRYAVQRSSNGLNWNTIFSSRRSSNNQQPVTKSYVDPSPLPGTNYYRLQTTSVDGAVAFSNVIAIGDESSSISLSPNPAKTVLQISGLSSLEKTKIMVVDLSGNMAISPKLITNRTSTYNLNIATLKPGNYMLRIESNGAVVTKQFVKD